MVEEKNNHSISHFSEEIKEQASLEKVESTDKKKDQLTNVHVNDFNLFYGDLQALKDINIAFYDKKIAAIIGPSGCGKSTFLRCFNRMNDLVENCHVKGTITIDNEDIFSPKTDVCALRSKVGMVFQKPNPFPKSIFENVAYGLRIRGEKNKKTIAEKVEKSLREAWIWDEVKDRILDSAFSLSGGQQQRLCIARALVTDPEILLLDEPTSALDPKSTNKIEELLLALKNLVTVLIVTHNFGQAGRIADYTAFLYLGELIEYSKTAKMFTNPKDKRTEEYLTSKFG